MNQATLSTVWDRGGPAIELLADSSGVLILLAAGFLVFRTFRERYLLAWILGWSFYLVYRVSTASSSLITPPAWLIGKLSTRRNLGRWGIDIGQFSLAGIRGRDFEVAIRTPPADGVALKILRLCSLLGQAASWG